MISRGRRERVRRLFGAALILFSSVIVSSAVVAPPRVEALTFSLDTVMSGDQPAGTAPWLTLSFMGNSGPVSVTFGSLLTSGQFVTKWYFNLDPGISPERLNFTFLSGAAAASIKQGISEPGCPSTFNCYEAGGNGAFDIEFSFPSSVGSQFTTGTSAWEVTCGSPTAHCAGFGADSFSFESELPPVGGAGPLHSAAQVHGIPGSTGDGGGWIAEPTIAPPTAVPEPTTLGLVGAGLAGLALLRRRLPR